MRWSGVGVAAAVWVALGTVQVARADEGGWETVSSGALTIKTRAGKEAQVYEYLVEGVLAANAFDLQTALTNPERFPKFMPHVEETRVLHRSEGMHRVYTRVNPPVGSRRDFVTEVRVLERVKPDGTGTFRQTWRALPDAVPEHEGITRVRINEGSWEISPHPSGGSRVSYRFRVHPGMWVPRFLADLANEKAIPETVASVVKEAARLGRERRSSAEATPQLDPRT